MAMSQVVGACARAVFRDDIVAASALVASSGLAVQYLHISHRKVELLDPIGFHTMFAALQEGWLEKAKKVAERRSLFPAVAVRTQASNTL